MKPEEQIVGDYLEKLHIGPVSFEPDGNIPPDFSLGTSIGVEVRRLNQNYFGGPDPKGLEELAIPLWQILAEAISTFDNQFGGKSYWVFIEFGRPSMQGGRATAKSVRDSLQDFLRRGGQAPESLNVNRNLTLVVYPATPIRPRVFRLGGGRDWDSGGGLVSMYVDNITYCIEEKSQKIAACEDRYEIWWLVLVDFMGWGMDRQEKSKLRSGIPGPGRFDRVIVLGNQYGEVRLDLQKKKA